MRAAIYLRTSTTEQHPEKQLKECQDFLASKGYELDNIYLEKLSGYKDITRPKYEEVKEKARRGEIKAVIVWALDRWVRNRETLLNDVTILRTYGCKLHSVQEAWLEAINIDGPLGKTIQDFLLGIVGSLAQMESQRKAERTRMSYNNRKGRWGRKGLTDATKQAVIESYKAGHSYSRIVSEVIYYDKNRNEKHISKGAVHKIITEWKLNNPSFIPCSSLTQIINNETQS